MLGRYCNGAPQKWPNWGTEFGAENSTDCGRLGRPPDERSPRFLIRQALGRPGEAPAYAGTDFIIARDGRIAALYLFFDSLVSGR